MDRWTEVELFLAIVERQGLQKAGEALGMSKAAVSRHLASLEDRLGVQLVVRNTRRLNVTEPGRLFYERCKQAHADLSEAEAAVNEQTLNPKGLLTITASLSFAMLHIGPLLPEFAARYPEVRVNVVTANYYVDLIENGIDLAVRTREAEPDSSITVRKLASTRRVLVASPAYLHARGAPTTLAELAAHNVLQYSLSNHADELHFVRNGETMVLPIRPTMISNDGQVLRAAALRGHGILVQPKYIVEDDVLAGRLVPVLDEFELPMLTINLAYPSRRFVPAKTRAFIEFIVAEFKQQRFEARWSR
jgi:DNA-binding transcriptional LysR family regulator